jgi:hypothetical protein
LNWGKSTERDAAQIGRKDEVLERRRSDRRVKLRVLFPPIAVDDQDLPTRRMPEAVNLDER